MADKIKASDLFEEGLFSKEQKGAERFAKTLTELQLGISELMTLTKNKINVINPDNYKDIVELNKQLQNSVTLLEQKTKIDVQVVKAAQEAEKLKQQEIKTQQEANKLLAQEAKERERAAKVLKGQQKALNELQGEYKKGVKSLSDLKKQLKELEFTGRTNGKLYKALKQEFEQLDKKVRGAEEGVGEFQRSVGNYKGALTDAIKETGIFNTQVGKLVVGLGELKKKFEENSKEGGGFSDKLKLGVAGGIGLAIGALTALASVNSAVAQGFEKIGAQLGGFITGGFKGAAAAAAFKDALFASYQVLRDLGLQLQAFTLDEQDYADIAQDTTIGFKERNAALEESIRLSKERAAISLQIAQTELDVINKQVAAEQIGLRKAAPELLDKQAEALKKVNEAVNAQNNLLRENAQLSRQLQIERTNIEIDLLLKNKQSANARKIILEKELADEKVQLEQRKKDAFELLQVNVKTTNEELRLFKDGYKVKFDSNKLVNEQDAIKLKQQIESIQFLDENNKLVGLGVEGQKTLAEIVAKYQKENLDYLDTKKKLQEEEIKRTQRIAEINAQIGIAQQTDDIKSLEEAYSTLNNAIDKNLEEQLKNENVFSSKLQAQRKLQIKLRDDEAQDIFDAKVKLLQDQANLEIENANNSIADEKIRAAEIKKINAQLQIDLGNIAGNKQAEEELQKQKDLDTEKAIAKKKLDIALEYGNKALDIAEQVLEKQSQKRQEFYDKELAQRETSIEKQRSLAERGLANTLAFEEAQKAKAELAREQEKKKEERRQKTIAFLRLLAGYAEEDPNTAFPKAVAQLALASLYENSFAEGVEKLEGPGTETSDSILARLSKNESVITAKGTKENAGLPTAMNEGKVDEYFANKYLPKIALENGMTGATTAGNMAASLMLHELMGVNERLQSLEKAIINKREVHTNIDNVGNVITADIQNGFKKVVTKLRARPRI